MPDDPARHPHDQGGPGHRDRGHDIQPGNRDRLATEEGQITVAESVVQKIAGKACREIAGVHAMGASGARAFGSIRERIPGSTGPNVAQGVGVEVGEKEAAIDLDIVVEYGVSIAELGRSIQRNVKQSVERMTGLRVVEVNSLSTMSTSRLTATRTTASPACHDRAAGRPAAASSVIDGIDVDAVAAAVQCCSGVAALDGGPFGEVTTTCPAGRSPAWWLATAGSRFRSGPGGCSGAGPGCPDHRGGGAVIGHRLVDVAIADVDDPPAAPSLRSRRAAARPGPGPAARRAPELRRCRSWM